MAYAFANPAGMGTRTYRRDRRSDALDSARGIVAWTLVSVLMFWLPLGLALTH